jgi:fluoroacetyl-CoA thioesterase
VGGIIRYHIKYKIRNGVIKLEYNLKEGLSYSMEITVDDRKTANFYGSGNLDVFATPAMIALMENAAKDCAQQGLPEGYSTVGIEINVKHIKATPIGMKVKVEVLLEKIDRSRLYFKVEAYDENSKIGEGTHIRYIVNSEEFLKKIINC